MDNKDLRLRRFIKNEKFLRRRLREHPIVRMSMLDLMEADMLSFAKGDKPLKGNQDLLRRRLREHLAFHGESKDEHYWLDLLEFALLRYEKGIDSLAETSASFTESFPEFWSGYIENSKAVPFAWKVCEALVRRLLRLEAQAKTVPVEEREIWKDGLDELKQWAYGVAGKTRTEPKGPRGRNAQQNMLRNIIICDVVRKIHDCSDKPYTDKINPESSACYAVRQRLVAKQLDNLSYGGVCKIWEENGPPLV